MPRGDEVGTNQSIAGSGETPEHGDGNIKGRIRDNLKWLPWRAQVSPVGPHDGNSVIGKLPLNLGGDEDVKGVAPLRSSVTPPSAPPHKRWSTVAWMLSSPRRASQFCEVRVGLPSSEDESGHQVGEERP